MRAFGAKLVFVTCVLVGAAVFVSAQGPAPQAPANGAPAAGPGRGPAPMTNLKVLPHTWTRQQVQALMSTFVTSLGTSEGCEFCHALDPDAPPPPPGGRGRANFALDTNPNKDIARKMITMTMAINDNYLKDVGEASTPEKVTCFTCHQGKEHPAMMPPDGWGRGNFSLSAAGPVVPARGAAPSGAPPAGAPAPARGN
jgi:hypothetical protein